MKKEICLWTKRKEKIVNKFEEGGLVLWVESKNTCTEMKMQAFFSEWMKERPKSIAECMNLCHLDQCVDFNSQNSSPSWLKSTHLQVAKVEEKLIYIVVGMYGSRNP